MHTIYGSTVMDMKVQGSRSGKALGVGELLAIALVALVVLHKIDHNKYEGTAARAGGIKRIDHKIMPSS